MALKFSRLESTPVHSINSDNLPSISMMTLLNSTDENLPAFVSDTARFVANGNRNSVINVWDLKRKSVLELIGHSSWTYCCGFHPYRELMFSANRDKTVRLWNLLDSSTIVIYKGHFGPVLDLDVDNSGNYFTTASFDRTVSYWCTNRKNPLRIFKDESEILKCKFSNDPNLIGAISLNGNFRFFDVRTAKEEKSFNLPVDNFFSMAFSPDNKFVAFSSGKTIEIWELKEGKKFLVLNKKFGKVINLSFSSSNSNKGKYLLASSGSENDIQLWDIFSKEPLISTYSTKKTPIDDLKFTKGNLLLAVGRFLS